MSVRTYEGLIEHGQVRLKDAPTIAEGTKVYVVVPEEEWTALDPMPTQIAASVKRALRQYEEGDVFEIQDVDDLKKLVETL
jgi:hypothetical protein